MLVSKCTLSKYAIVFYMKSRCHCSSKNNYDIRSVKVLTQEYNKTYILNEHTTVNFIICNTTLYLVIPLRNTVTGNYEIHIIDKIQIAE